MSVFHVKCQRVMDRKADRPALYAYMGAIIKDNGSIPVIINGTHNHVHVLCIMSRNISLAKLVEEMKRHSSRWMKTRGEYYREFAWQGGYAGFSVSQSVFEITRRYIANQERHHAKKTYKRELSGFLNLYKVDHNPDGLVGD